MREKIIALLIAVVVFASAFAIHPQDAGKNELKKFSSYEEMEIFLKTNVQSGSYYGLLENAAPALSPKLTKLSGSAKTASADFSTTNIQVSGVDEADIVKTDGKYIYVVSAGKVVIVEAYPAESAKVLSEIKVNGTVSEIFINGNRLVVFGSGSGQDAEENPLSEISGASVAATSVDNYRYYGSAKTFVNVYDIADRKNPVLKRNLILDGGYFDSRMIGDYVYVIVNKPAYSYRNKEIPLPEINENGKSKKISAEEIFYFEQPDYSYSFTTISAINTQNDFEQAETKTFLLGESQQMFVSQENIYIVYQKRASEIKFYERIVSEVILPVASGNMQEKITEIQNSNLTSIEKFQKISKIFKNYIDGLNPEKAAEAMKMVQEKTQKLQREIEKETEKTIVHKISISGKNIEYKINGEVPGKVLNQFSMDEHKGFFRIATTTGEVWGENPTAQNHVYVLDSELKIIGKLEDLASGERIYSARFLGDKAYLVTFKKVDPLFVIDLSSPEEPKVLGYLKIPGYSDYLHPYDENHVIGIGKEAVAAEEGNFAWYQGVKLSLFDVSDVSNPKEISKFNIGDRGTDSPALHDHKAFLFDKKKGLLVIPISLHEIDRAKYPEPSANTYGEFVWQGAYVLGLDLEKGFVLKGKVTHDNETAQDVDEYSYRYGNYQTQIKRSLYIGDVLYTVSEKIVKANALGDLGEIFKIEF